MAADHALRRELNRRIRDDLITLGIVSDGPAVTIADTTQASPGDLIICTRNDHSVEAGEPGRTLANGDLLRIEAITRDGLLVRRARMPTREPGSAGGPTDTSCSVPIRMPNWATRSPTTPPRAAP
jgi:hypothetical protein